MSRRSSADLARRLVTLLILERAKRRDLEKVEALNKYNVKRYVLITVAAQQHVILVA